MYQNSSGKEGAIQMQGSLVKKTEDTHTPVFTAPVYSLARLTFFSCPYKLDQSDILNPALPTFLPSSLLSSTSPFPQQIFLIHYQLGTLGHHQN